MTGSQKHTDQTPNSPNRRHSPGCLGLVTSFKDVAKNIYFIVSHRIHAIGAPCTYAVISEVMGNLCSYRKPSYKSTYKSIVSSQVLDRFLEMDLCIC